MEYTTFIETLINRINGNKEGDIKEELEYFFSGTDDNISCGERVFIKPYRDSWTRKKTMGLGFKNYTLVNIAYRFEDEDFEEIPNEIKKSFPKLSKKDWSAFKRLVTLIFIGLEKEMPLDRKDK